MRIPASAMFLIAISSAAAQGQNLIQNPGFEVGQIPTMHDQVPYATGWYKNCGPTTPGGTPDLFDSRSPHCLYGIPSNKWGNRSERTGGYRYVGFSGTAVESVKGTLASALSSCTYTIEFWASAVDGIRYECPKPLTATPPNPNNRIEVVLRKGNDCTTGKVVHATSPVTVGAWQHFTGQFTLTAAEASAAYDRIEFRLAPTQLSSTTLNIVYLDDVSLVVTGQPTLTSDFQLTTVWVDGSSPVFITATMAPLALGANFWWKVEEVDASGGALQGTVMENPVLWWGDPLTNVFRGYAAPPNMAGRFWPGHRYRITRGVWSPCVPWLQTVKTMLVDTH